MADKVFYYYEQFGQVCCGKAPIDDGVMVGGSPEGLVRSVTISDHEFELSLDQLRKLYPHD